MKFFLIVMTVLGLIVTSCTEVGSKQVQPAAPQVAGAAPDAAKQAPPTGPQAGVGRGAGSRLRVENRTYTFPDTKEEMPYVLFVSSKVSKDKKSPLIVALHGLGGAPTTFGSLNLAEEGGYIVVGPMGYNRSGWYGMPAMGGPRAPRGTGTLTSTTTAVVPQPPGRGGPLQGGTAVTDQTKVRELSEKDVMNVLDLVRKEFNVDDRRIYLMGHSMGGGGTLYLGQKYASTWAAIAAIAPAAFGLQMNILDNLKDMPVMIVQGDGDTLVRPEGTRRWVDEMKARKMTCEYREIAGADHGSVLGPAIPEIYKFFGQHSKPEPH
jgi:predicted esterase